MRRHGVDLAYSPMIMSSAFLHSAEARAADFSTCPEDHPLITQIACRSGPEFALCAEELSTLCEGVDLNCGCPQRWAMEEGYGAALLKHPELIEDLVKAARAVVPRWRVVKAPQDEERRIAFSVSIKIRLVPCPPRAIGEDGDSSSSTSYPSNVQLTTELVRRAACMGVDWVTVHGRTPSQHSNDPARWHDVAQIIAARVPHHTHTAAPLPIFLNGDVKTLDDAFRAYQISGCQGVMAARGLLQDPALFEQNRPQDPWNLYREWLDLCQEYSASLPFSSIHRHAYWILEKHIGKKGREMLHKIDNMANLCDFSPASVYTQNTPI
ncbi:unnamed protein product [Hydatigera taeniaeformis]|uniref:tRNA-dihydrouridine synthase n=1 Tax=Hydatigena taeniaeformis TaxID=6205 RepID=A0A0R3XBN3_HYDTA|nr:unnamed protein product [Hydatigera taeniaeformis]